MDGKFYFFNRRTDFPVRSFGIPGILPDTKFARLYIKIHYIFVRKATLFSDEQFFFFAE